jgi:hypothetical protein
MITDAEKEWLIGCLEEIGKRLEELDDEVSYLVLKGGVCSSIAS